MSIKPEKYKYTCYAFKIHVHIDWLTVFKHPLENISSNAGQEYVIRWVDLAFYTLYWIFNMLAHGVNSLQEDKSPHLSTLFGIQTNQSSLFLLHDAGFDNY
jgi:hypothetical protein